MFVSFLLVLIYTVISKGSHFNGGSITWVPLNPYDNSSSVVITITQSYSWTYPTVNCMINVPITTPNYNASNTNLICVANCSTDGNYTYKKVNILTDCTSASLSLGVMTSQRSVNITFPVGTYFWISYTGSSWRSLKNFVNISDPGWNITSLIDLQIRPDGIINTPPVAEIASPQYVIVNVRSTIIIPVSDVNINDDVRCRWSSQNSSFDTNECGDICTASSSLPNDTILSNCTLSFMSTVSAVWYGIALQVEDFINTTSTDPMSSVPIQFLIYVLPTPKCPQPPIILPLTDCLQVEVNVSTTFILYVMNLCNVTLSTITTIMPRTFIDGMDIDNLINSTTNTSLVYTTLTWTPQFYQIGSQQFCAVAYTNEKVQSDTYCVTFNVTTSEPCATTTTSTTTTTDTTTSTTDSTTSTSTTETISTTTTTISVTTITTSISTTPSTVSETTTISITSTTTSISTNTFPQTISTTETPTISTSLTTTIISSINISTQTTSINTITTITNSITSKTQSSGSNQTDLPLIVGLSLLALLLALCYCCCWLYHLLWGTAARRRKQNQNTKPLKQSNEIKERLFHREEFHPTRRSQKYLISNESDYQNTRNNVSSHNSTETVLISPMNNKRENNIQIKKSHKKQNSSQESHYDQNISTLDNQSKSSIIVTPLNKLKRDSKIIENNQSIKSSKLQQEEQKYPIQLSNDIHVIKLPRNKVSSSHNTIDHRSRYSTETSNTIQISSRQNILQTLNIHPQTLNNNYKRKRPSSFGEVTVRRIKKDDKTSASFVTHHHIMTKQTNNRVSVTLVKKEQS